MASRSAAAIQWALVTSLDSRRAVWSMRIIWSNGNCSSGRSRATRFRYPSFRTEGKIIKTPTPCTLNGRLVLLEPLSVAHARDLFASFAEDPTIWRWLPISPPASEAEMRAGIDAHLKRQAAGEALAFAQVNIETGRAVGVTNYLDI